MESSLQASPDVDPKAEFRKPSGDSANRKYRRRSPVGGSPSSFDGSPRRKRSSSPVSRRESAKISDDRHRKEDRRELDRDYGKSSYERRDKYAKDIARDSSKFGSRSDRDSRGRANSDYPKRETERRSRDSSRDSDRYSRDKSDGSGYRIRDKDRDTSYAGNQKHKDMEACDRVSSGRRRTISRTEDVKDSDRDWRKEDRGVRDSKLDSRSRFVAEKSPDRKGQCSPTKKLKLRSPDSVSEYKKDDKQPSSSNEIPEKASVTDADIDAAKLAAVRAAELVNKNLVGTGYMSTEQKKKLLWGSKKNTPIEEAAHRWDSSIFADREKQEKFNKLMGVKGDIKVENKPEISDAEKEKIQMDLEKQYTAGLRRRDGRTVGLGL